MSDRHKFEGEDEMQLQLLEVAEDATLRERGGPRREQVKALIFDEPMEQEASRATGAKTLH